MSNTSTKTNDSNTETVAKPVTDQYIKNVSSGFIYHVLPVEKDKSSVYLRTKNSYTKFKFLDIKQGIVKGIWSDPNEHEIRDFQERDKLYFQEFTFKLIKRIMYTQLLLELDDDLKEDFSDDKYMQNILEKSEKQFIRVVKETYPRMYAIDKNTLNTFMRSMEEFISKISKVLPHEFLFMNVAIDRYLENPELFTPENVEIVKVNE